MRTAQNHSYRAFSGPTQNTPTGCLPSNPSLLRASHLSFRLTRSVRSFLTTFALLVVAFAVASSFTARASSTSILAAVTGTQTWTPGGAGDGNGTWDTVTGNWSGNGNVPTSGALWSNSNSALFTGTGGNVTVTSVIAHALIFDATGPYALTSGALTMSGSNIIVDSAAAIGTNITATAAGLFITGNNILTLTGTDTLGSKNLAVDSGAVAISGGGSVSDYNTEIGQDSTRTARRRSLEAAPY